ncbi:uncharacterized protein LOC128552359 [Mercenaria mercenaria]|uniref:uncharacterized protein LOC128552359 n=1 Tax=Mercenaria mercenaria TaxID=6596 RepID=UPI00234E7441|nr:uncharacterized protein LOC128552359 [Mercenaria mercenaria]
MNRHPEISLRSPRQLGKERAVIKPEHVEKWFTDFESFIKDTVPDPVILLDPTRLYNADETGFSMCPKTGHVLGLRGAKSVYNITASDRSQITVMAGMSAAAHYLRPMIVFAGQRFTRNMLEGFDDAVLGRSENGWMDSELFVMWLKTVFIPDIEERQVKKPVILFVDGHKTHMTIEASDVCKDNGIILYCLLEHASHLMQPCDLRLFSSLKETWKSSLREWQIDHVGQYVTKFEFAAIFKKAWVNASKVENAVNGFRDAGLFPLDKDKVLKTDKFQTSILFRQKESKSNETEDNRTTEQTETAQDEESRPDTQMRQVEQTVAKQNETRQMVNKEKQTENEKQDEASKEKENIDPKSIITVNVKVTTDNSLSPQPSTSGAASPMSKILNIPKPKTTKKRSFKREILPKAITGEEFRKILSEKKRKKEEEEAEKQRRKVQREQKRLEREKEKQIKAEQRLLKKNRRRRKRKNWPK